MGFFDLLKKLGAEKEEITAEKLSVSELEPWIISKKKQIEKQEESFLRAVRERILQLIKELDSEISILKGVNVEGRKAEEKIKIIVKENLNNYIHYLERLVRKLNEINEEKGIIEKINFIFSTFKKSSSMSFEKSTFLIGKELESVKESIRNFFDDLESILKENKEWIDLSKQVYSVENKVKKFNEIKNLKSSAEKLIDEHSSRISKLKSEIQAKHREIENIKKSGGFLAEMRKREQLEQKKAELDKEIYNLKELIDFKSLANFFHSSKKEMGVIKIYKEDFKNAFQKADGEDILRLINEAKLQNEIISKKSAEITEKEKEIASVILGKTGIENLETEIRAAASEIELLNSKKSSDNKRYMLLSKNFSEALQSIREELAKINVELSDPAKKLN